ncbi:MAG TPA: tetratricopeptide repeat protein [Moraxellaceae bacterium]|nr:tetratricopeptide repeat protein [Moraxellaceae bacterium]
MMTSIPFLRRPPQLLAAAIVALSLPALASAADLRQRLSVRQEANEVVIGETMHDFYQGDSFAALNTLVLAKAMGRIDDSVTSSEMLLGDLYTAFGMPDEADNIFARLVTRDMRSQTRNETMFRQGRLQYRQGKYFEAERILNVPLDAQMTPLETERRVMLANVLMSRNAFDEARAALNPITLDNPMGPYATYNIGVSHLRSNHAPEGKQLLEQVMNLPVSDSEINNALKDRAALALGYDYLQLQQPEKAREALVNVRLKGPFSNNAILALGWSYYERKDYKRALAYWLELLTRNTADASVQEAMLLAPRAYEALQANQQALYGYQLAASTLTGQLDTLDRIEQDIGTPGWLDRLDPSPMDDRFGDPLAVPDTVVPRDPVTIAQLYTLFSSHPFNEGFQQYSQLKRLRSVLDARSNELRAMREMAAYFRSRQAALQGIAARAAATRARLTAVADRFPALDKRARQLARTGGLPTPAAAGSGLKTMEQQFKLQQVDSALAKQADTPAVRALRERLRILKGLVMMDNASRAAPSSDEIYADLAKADAQLRLLQLRMDAVQQLLADNQKLAARNDETRIRDFEARLQDAYKNLDASLAEYRTYLNQLALNHLEDSRNRINNDIAEAHLSIARLQDVSLVRDGKSPAPGPAGAPTP